MSFLVKIQADISLQTYLIDVGVGTERFVRILWACAAS